MFFSPVFFKVWTKYERYKDIFSISFMLETREIPDMNESTDEEDDITPEIVNKFGF